MMSTSLFDVMGDYPLQEDYLDQTFGLSAEILAADLGTDGSILDFGNWPAGGLKPDTAQEEAQLGDLLQDSDDPLGEEWMETLDLSVFLDNEANTALPPAPAAPLPAEVVAKPSKQDVRQVAFDILKKLLTGEINDPTLPVSPEPLATEETIADNLLESLEQASKLGSAIKIQPEFTLDNGDIVEIEPQIELEYVTDIARMEQVELSIVPEVNDEPFTDSTDPLSYLYSSDLESPVSQSEVESLLLSGPTSPNESITFHTIDSSACVSLHESCAYDGACAPLAKSDVSSQSSDSVTPKKKYRSRISPYSSDNENISCLSKKDRKKRQNKNAATRYRQKKRVEKESVTDQEKKMAAKNKELHDKVDSLQREISYMKELMNEIYKAKNIKM